MDEQTRAKQIWIENHAPKHDKYLSYYGQKVYCSHCGFYVTIMSRIGMKDPDPASQNPYEVFKTSCQHEAVGEFSSGYDAEWNFWIN